MADTPVSNIVEMAMAEMGVRPEYEMAYPGGNYCFATDRGFTCTCAEGHGGDEHVAHTAPGRVVHRWPKKGGG